MLRTMALRQKKRIGTVIVLSCALALAGCISLGNDHLLNDSTMTQIKPGETTKAQVSSLLGEPDYRRQTTMAGHTYEWWAYDAERSVVNPLEYLLLVGFFFNGIGTPDDRWDLHLFIDPDGVVTHVHRQKTGYDTGSIISSQNITSKLGTSIRQLGQPVAPTSYQDAMSVNPGP